MRGLLLKGIAWSHLPSTLLLLTVCLVSSSEDGPSDGGLVLIIEIRETLRNLLSIMPRMSPLRSLSVAKCNTID